MIRVRRRRRDGWDGPDATFDEWGYSRRLKRWAEALGHRLATAPLADVDQIKSRLDALP